MAIVHFLALVVPENIVKFGIDHEINLDNFDSQMAVSVLIE